MDEKDERAIAPATKEVAPGPISRVPCPFCGSTFAGKVTAKNGFRLQCPCCDAQTGVATKDEILKAYWERRPFDHAAAQGSVEIGPINEAGEHANAGGKNNCTDATDLADAIANSTVRIINQYTGQWQLAEDGKALIVKALRAYRPNGDKDE